MLSTWKKVETKAIATANSIPMYISEDEVNIFSPVFAM